MVLVFAPIHLFAQDSTGWPPDQGQASQPESGGQAEDNDSGFARQPLAAGQLEQLVAPIALYPDALVAQVLAAATYPQQVMEADRWRQSQAYATPDQIAAAADGQNWDPSVKALTAFPQVLAQMDRNLQWTTDLGNAYFNQPQDVLEAVQVMRQRAQAAGSLRSTPQEIVRYDGPNIQLAPADPQLVYVPTYNPWSVYGDAVTPYPGYSLLGVIGDVFGAILHYGPGIAMSAFARTPWGWLAWGLDWLGHALLFHDSAYYSHSATVADWGFPHRGFYAYAGHGFARMPRDSARAWGHESWRNGRVDTGGWHSFGREPERAGNWNRANNRGFESFHNQPDAGRRLDGRAFSSNRSVPENRSFSRESDRGGFDNRAPFRSPSRDARARSTERTFAGNFARNDFGGRSSDFASHTTGKSHGGGSHLFAGGHSERSFDAGRSAHNHGERAPKSFGRGKGFSSKNFGGGKSFGGHSHEGGNSGSHGGGKHHR